jgi:hypothetical protein
MTESRKLFRFNKSEPPVPLWEFDELDQLSNLCVSDEHIFIVVDNSLFKIDTNCHWREKEKRFEQVDLTKQLNLIVHPKIMNVVASNKVVFLLAGPANVPLRVWRIWQHEEFADVVFKRVASTQT